MGGLTFINPAMAIGALAIAIPLAIHLLTRRTPVLIVFPTLRFLYKAQANQSRLFRIRHYLLLCIRTLIILLVLFAFLRPVLSKGTLAATKAPEGGAAAIIIVDASLSMGYSGAGVSHFGRALSATESVLNALGTTDIANVIFAGNVPEGIYDAPRETRAQLRAELGNRHYQAARSDIDSAIALALEQLDDQTTRNREIHFISDFQRTNWASVNFSTIPEHVKTVFIPVTEGAIRNAAVTEMKIRPASPAIGESAEIICTVANYGPEPQSLPVSLTLEGEAPLESTLSVDAGMSATASFRVRFNGSGVFEAVASIPPDGLREDDTHHAAVTVSERFPVVILSDAPVAARDASHRFLAAALDPFGGGSSVFVPEVMALDAFDRFAAARAHAVMVSQAGAMSEATAVALADYLKDGGRVAWFAEGPADPGNLALLLAKSDGALKLPFTLAGYVAPDANEAGFSTLASANYDEPMLKKFRESGALADLHFFSYFTTKREETQGQVLMKYDNGNIALARTNFGRGSLLLANFSPGLEGSDVQKSTIFVPLVHEMVKALGLEGGGARSFEAGLPCSTSITLTTPEAPVRFANPAGESVSAVLDLNGTTGSVIFGETGQTGFYRVFSGDAKLASIAVNTDPRESNLETLTAAQLREMAKRSQDTFLAATGSDAGTLRAMREGAPLWHFFLAAALAFLAIEQGCALMWRR